MGTFQPEVPESRFTATPVAAYRADLGGRTVAFGTEDDAWLVAASAVHLAATSDERSRRQHLAGAVDAAIGVLGGARIDAFVDREWLGARMPVESVAVLCFHLQERGALRLARVMLDDLLVAAVELTPVQRGRILALVARGERMLTHFDESAERYGYIAELGRELGSVELEARAEIGLVGIAQMKGNLPAMQAHSLRAAALSHSIGHRGIERLAQQSLTIFAAKTNQFEAALIAAWKAFELCSGDPIIESEVLQNIGQLMLESGRLHAARAGFAAIMTRPAPAVVHLNALGGLALVSGYLGNEATVEWCVREIWRARQLHVPRYEVAAALLESALALRELNRADEAERFRMESRRIAVEGGFHELTYRAEHLPPRAPRAEPRPLSELSAAVEHDLMAFEPRQLPKQVEFQAAPA